MKQKLTTAELRRKFIDYFKRHHHVEVSSSSLVPQGDPTLLFTNAGMVQFKDLFLGKEQRSYRRAVSVQRCMRASGKHNDLENVGYTTRHHTFFEMLGNFSFGDYFKREAIQYAWDFLTNELQISPTKLWITVHRDDQEAAQIWLKEIKIDPEHFSRCGDEDNFWAMGEVGPCGYCSEIYYDHGQHLPGGPPGSPEQGGDRYVEIWNLVFMQFSRDKNGKMTPLPKPSVDTGMGLERIAAVVQGVHDNYETDIFCLIYAKFKRDYAALTYLSSDKVDLQSPDTRVAMRVVADHIRAATFMIADGIRPSNEGEGYVLRSIIRRAIYHLYKLGINQPFFYAFVYSVVETMADAYPEIKLLEQQSMIAGIIESEEIKFLGTLDRGIKMLEQAISELKTTQIPGDLAFTLHDTYGFPIVLTIDIARKRGFTVDQLGFATAMEKQREAARAASKFGVEKELKLPISGATDFVGYDTTSGESQILGIFTLSGESVLNLNRNQEGLVVLKKTPFYAESGGQVGDRGELIVEKSGTVFAVSDTQKYGSLFVHYGKVECGELLSTDLVKATINHDRRQAIMLNHSAAHLLHRSLQLVLGKHATQRGSLVDDKRLRFDFVHFSALTAEEIREIEFLVNANIRSNLSVQTTVKSLGEAMADGVTALFGEKYGDQVRVVTMGDFSKELCGGTHIKNTGEIGIFKIISETGVAAGVRRVEAVTGENALLWFEQIEQVISSSADLLKTSRNQLPEKVQQLIAERNSLAKELERLKADQAAVQSGDLVKRVININGIKVLAEKLKGVDKKSLRQICDTLKQKLQSGVVVLSLVEDEKVQLVVGVTADLVDKINAGILLKYLAEQLGGSGGGRADMALGGGTKIEKLDQALNSVVPWIEQLCCK